MATPPNAPYKVQQRRYRQRLRRGTLLNGTPGGRKSRAHPDRTYVWDGGGTCWRAENYYARFGTPDQRRETAGLAVFRGR